MGLGSNLELQAGVTHSFKTFAQSHVSNNNDESDWRLIPQLILNDSIMKGVRLKPDWTVIRLLITQF